MRTFALAALGAALFVSSTARADGLSIPYTQTTLKNGLVVIFAEDHTVPISVVNITYKVGSRFEENKRTGFAHLFEHLMFMGTRRAPTKMFDGWMEGAGGWNNAWTSEDRTDYYDVAPPTALPLLLWLEADRLRDLGPLMNQDKLNAQRDVVRNERRQNTENTPYGIAELRIPELLYPNGHPYHHPVIGSHEDLEAAQVDDVKNFFATYYDPANASLVVAGDFDPKAVMPTIDQYFGSIPSRGKPNDPGAPGYDSSKTTLTSVVRETDEDNVELGKVIYVWQTPKHFQQGDAELDLIASLLAKGKASRLYKTLVYDQKIAQDVEAAQESGFLGSRFEIGVTARPGVKLGTIEAAIDKELDALRKTAVKPDELERAKNIIETGFVDRLQGARDRAALLNEYQAEVGDPGFAQKDIDRYRSATADGVKNAAAAYLPANARVILHIIPKGAKDDTLKTDAKKVDAKKTVTK
jgi:predicted Zn-dependent peptidase